MPDLSNVNVWAGGVAVLIAAVVSALISLLNRRGAAKKSDLDNLQSSYGKLQATYLIENDRLNAKVDKLQNEKDALLNKQEMDRQACEGRISELEHKLTILMAKLPEPGTVQPVQIVGAAVALPVEVIAATNPLPVKLVAPLPLPMTAAQAVAAVQSAVDALK